jgi:hypothetical protein
MTTVQLMIVVSPPNSLCLFFSRDGLNYRHCWMSGLNPLDHCCLSLIITPGTSPRTMGALDHIVVPKIKTKIVLTVGDYFKRVSYFSNAVQLLAIPYERSKERSSPFPFLQKEILLLDYCSLETDSCFQYTNTFPSSLDEFIHSMNSYICSTPLVFPYIR